MEAAHQPTSNHKNLNHSNPNINAVRRRSVRSDGEAKSGLRLTSIFLFHIVQKVSSARLDRCSDVRFGRRQKYKDHVGRACVEGVDAVHLLVQQREAHAPARRSSCASKMELARQQDEAHASARRSSCTSMSKLARQQEEAHAPARRSSRASKVKLTRQQDEAHTPATRSSHASKVKLTRQQGEAHTPVRRSSHTSFFCSCTSRICSCASKICSCASFFCSRTSRNCSYASLLKLAHGLFYYSTSKICWHFSNAKLTYEQQQADASRPFPRKKEANFAANKERGRRTKRAASDRL